VGDHPARRPADRGRRRRGRGVPAGALFCARAQAADPSFGLDATTAPAVAQLCRRLDGLPLAIELAAARVRALAVTALAERIDHRFALLAGGSHRQADRHRTLRAMVDWSYALLTDREALLFDRLSVFAGRFTLPAAEEVAAGDPLASFEVAGLLAELADKSLVSVDRTEDRRYRLLDTLRAYGAERLEVAGTAGRALRPTRDPPPRRAEELGARARGPDEGAALATIDLVLDDLRLAHGWLVAAGEVDAACACPPPCTTTWCSARGPRCSPGRTGRSSSTVPRGARPTPRPSRPRLART
jgi:predicted ATPase